MLLIIIKPFTLASSISLFCVKISGQIQCGYVQIEILNSLVQSHIALTLCFALILGIVNFFNAN